jgi:hypothetical protein
MQTVPQKPWFADRVYLRDEIDLTPLCLGIIAPIRPGNPEFEEMLDELRRCREQRRKMRPKWAQLLRDWIKEFQAGYREQYRIRRVQPDTHLPVSDQHFIELMFRSFSHQFALSGHRIGKAECANLSIYRLAQGFSGPSPFSRTWTNANSNGRRKIRQINYLLREPELS